MNNSDLSRLSADITALNLTLQQLKDSQERLAGSVDDLRHAYKEARDDQGSRFGLLFGAILGGVLIGTLIGNLIGEGIAEMTRPERTAPFGDPKRK